MTGYAKSIVLYAGIIAAVMVGAGWVWLGQPGRPVATMRRQPIDISQINYLTNGSMVLLPVAQRDKMSAKERLRWLEKYGQVPEDADYGSIDWVLAQNTSWWGRRLDPNNFWKGRVVWLDDSAQKSAQRHGRFYPPIPYEESWHTNYPGDEGIDWGSFQIESANIHYADSSKERGFWDNFNKTKPTPPSDLIREQGNVASSIMNVRYSYVVGGNPSRLKPKDIASLEGIERHRAAELGYPPESLTDDALYWAYVLKCRQGYAQFPRLPSILMVDTKLITEPLTADQLKAANAWKLAYLQRLRREKTDEQYIQAYLKAWNLTEKEVFGQ